MQLNFDDGIIKRLQEYVVKNAKILLDLDDGSGPYTNHAIACSMGINYRIIMVNNDANIDDYQEELKSNLGIVYSKKYANYTLATNMKLGIKPPFNTWQLSGTNMLIDDSVEFVTKYFQEVPNNGK
ncbi:iron-sulfur cluster biosynthesis family protein [Periweissella beninensis]|uniref:Iron-sulfur cluster biosynthesis family protein n=1 Tax=Periweissella beninensis TaxID=504936 RepID=A0ABT0VHQ2_9LACO|nr:iron-sulfur cluster biosynthesis family protein [Periweissella beninensis]MBM7544075.1 uncharacterized protein YqkB [Periweissella beninensis]MCM2437368.1 iron-sulfur cluster biosynthesis family protein [Periweissella beninensis]